SPPTSPRRATRRTATPASTGCCSTAPNSSATADHGLARASPAFRPGRGDIEHSGDSTMFGWSKRDMTRRDMLKLSAAGILGASISGWFNVLASRAAEQASQGAKHKSCILLWMNGGPAQSHTFDLKDGSEYKAIDTTVTDIKISEYLPNVAKQMEN